MKWIKGVVFYEAINSNPNGDPDRENEPRTLSDYRGIVSPVCIKRKIKNYVANKCNGQDGFDILVQRGNDFDELTSSNYLKDLLSKYYDVRDFGMVIPSGTKKDKPESSKKSKTTKHQASADEEDSEQEDESTNSKKSKSGVKQPDSIKGSVQVTISESIDAVKIVNMGISRMCASGQEQTLGKFKCVEYGLYRCEFSINPHIAIANGMTEKDLQLLMEAFENCWEGDASAARPDMRPRAIFVFEHENELGGGISKLKRAVKVVKNSEEPSRPEDYTISLDESGLPEGIKVIANKVF